MDSDTWLLVAYDEYMGRMGSIEGLFIAKQSWLDASYNKEVRLGEVLGKHSDVWCTLDRENFTILSDDQELISKLRELFPTNTLSGYNVLDYSRKCTYCGDSIDLDSAAIMIDGEEYCTHCSKEE